MSEPLGPAIRVTIFGEEYPLRSEKGEAHTRECARIVDEAIQNAHLSAHVAEPHKAAILAALQITDELLQRRADEATRTQRVLEGLSALRIRIEAALESPSAQSGVGASTGE